MMDTQMRQTGLLEPGETAECRDDSAGDEHTDASKGRGEPGESAECRDDDSAGDEHTDASNEHRMK